MAVRGGGTRARRARRVRVAEARDGGPAEDVVVDTQGEAVHPFAQGDVDAVLVSGRCALRRSRRTSLPESHAQRPVVAAEAEGSGERLWRASVGHGVPRDVRVTTVSCARGTWLLSRRPPGFPASPKPRVDGLVGRSPRSRPVVSTGAGRPMERRTGSLPSMSQCSGGLVRSRRGGSGRGCEGAVV